MRKIVMAIVLILLGMLFFSRQYSFTDLGQYQQAYKEVEIKGEVKQPGIYEMDWEASIQDVIDEAGGLLESGNCDSINRNQNIANHDVIVIPKKIEKRCVSINGDTIEQLDTLPGVGPKVAQRIIDYRISTPFQSIDEIKNVKGIGDAMFLKLQDLICL